MGYKIDQIEGIGAVYAEKLQAAANVLGRAANIQAFIEFVCMFSIIILLKCFCKDSISQRL